MTQEKKVEIIVACAMAVFFCLVMVLVVQLSIRANQRNLERQLMSTSAQLEHDINTKQNEIDGYESDKFLDEWILKELGYGKNGSKIFG